MDHLQLSTIQKNTMRYFLGCNKAMPIVALTGEMGWLLVHYRQMMIVLKMQLLS